MKKNIVFCDVDGTLIDGFKGLFDISDKTKEAIAKVKESSYFIVASGRSKCMLPKGLLNCNPDGFILNNGAYVEFENEVLKNHIFSETDLSKISDYNQKTKNKHIFINQNDIYIKDINDYHCLELLSNLGISKDLIHDKFNNDYNFAVEICMSEENAEDFVNEFKDEFKLSRQYTYIAYDINFLNDTKGDALEIILSKLDKSDLNTYCFGDSQNDVEMMHKCATSIAMGNAKEEVMKIANMTTDTVMNDGFAKAVIKLFN